MNHFRLSLLAIVWFLSVMNAAPLAAQSTDVSSMVWDSMQSILSSQTASDDSTELHSYPLDSAELNPDASELNLDSLINTLDSVYLTLDPSFPALLFSNPGRVALLLKDGALKVNPMFLPMVFNARPVQFHLCCQPAVGTEASIPDAWEFPLRSEGEIYVDTLRCHLLRRHEANRPDLAVYSMDRLPKPEKIEIRLKDRDISYQGIVPQKKMNVQIVKDDIPTQKDYNYTYWKFYGRFSAQLSQTYISPNWSSGGTSSNSALASVYLTANYNDNRLIQFDNVLDIQIGINSNPSDSLRSFSVGTDQMQLSSKLGVKAFSNWFYSLQAELITQNLNNYKPNTYSLKSSFLSPAKFFVSLGLDYKYEEKGKKKLSVLLTPLTYKMNYLLDNTRLDPTKFGIEEGKHFGHEFGIKLSSTYEWQITDNIFWNTYFYYYSNFNYIDSEWKNTFNFNLTRFFTAQLFVHLKFDDRITKNEAQKTLLQLKEILSLGFTYHIPSFRLRK